jgi:hypothetical protein
MPRKFFPWSSLGWQQCKHGPLRMRFILCNSVPTVLSSCLFLAACRSTFASQLYCPRSSIHVVMFWLSCPVYPVPYVCSSCHVRAVQFWGSSPLYLSSLTCPGWLFRPTCPGCIFQLFCLDYPHWLSCLSQSFCPGCPALALIFWPSSSLCVTRLTWPGWPVWSTCPNWLSRQSCQSFPVHAVMPRLPFSWLFCQGSPVSAVLSYLSCPVVFWPSCHLFLWWLSCHYCRPYCPLQLSSPWCRPTVLSKSEIYNPRNALAPASLPNLKYNFPK